MNPTSTVTIPRSDHIVSRSSLSLNSVRVLYRLRDHGFTAYLVGGCVRDLLLGREPKDFDIVTNATPGQIKRLFRNCRLVGRRFRLAHLHFQDEIIEVATFRSLQPGDDEPETPSGEPAELRETHRPPRHLKSTEGMILRDNVFGTPEEDAHRRDFTINALFYNIADFSIIDHVGGMHDLENGIIRIIGDPFERFTEDPVRMIRAIRFAALLGFRIEEETWRAILSLSETMSRAAPARLYEEVLKLLLCGEGAKVWQLLRQTGLSAALFPDFDAWLQLETLDFPHTEPGHALAWIDGRIQQGESVAPPLLFALLFGQYFEEKSARFREEGVPYQQSIDAAVAELLGELSPSVLIPHRMAVLIRSIFSMQRRFQKMPGRRSPSFVTHPGFTEALLFLRFRAESCGKGMETVTWWEDHARECLDTPPTATPQAGDEAPRRQRRRKRRRRRPQNAS
ncbi:polynucleotide adenylyltransferase PcnB [Geobacter sp. DSM 9736]|uniref:polynucleotide adenylyltransferase PcnB n=1 Tax=Geobacter sp. DSM 9736 TaxID=1277350 RepID=UPI000B5016B2|nr:polynucleotide adenylyltransferase PcnB [Geobacter sp. DSM 9736]SNB47837.1 poly(A) polymerase [Geobacter sp. DSM 9736]